MIAKGFTGRVEELISKTLHSFLGGEQNKTDNNHTKDLKNKRIQAELKCCKLQFNNQFLIFWTHAATMSQLSIFQ